MPRTRIPAVKRFWTHVRKTDDCWLWTSSINHKGYGLFRNDDQRYVPVHRWAYEEFVGPAGELHVLHHCDVPNCVKPTHLFLGTNQENVDDKMAKGRHAGAHKGQDHHMAKLTQEQVDLIRTSVDTPGIELARRFGVSPATISNIRHGRYWKG